MATTHNIVKQHNQIRFRQALTGGVLLLALVAGGITGDAVCGQHQTRPRQRIALNGFISHGTTGIPRSVL